MVLKWAKLENAENKKIRTFQTFRKQDLGHGNPTPESYGISMDRERVVEAEAAARKAVDEVVAAAAVVLLDPNVPAVDPDIPATEAATVLRLVREEVDAELDLLRMAEASPVTVAAVVDADDDDDEAAPVVLTASELLVLEALVKLNYVPASIDEIRDAFPSDDRADLRPRGEKTTRAAVKRLVGLEYADRPNGPRSGTIVTTKGSREWNRRHRPPKDAR